MTTQRKVVRSARHAAQNAKGKAAKAVQAQATSSVTPDSESIHTRAMLVSLGLSMWWPYAVDAGATEEVREAHHAKKGAGRYHKHLFGGHEESGAYKQVTAAAAAARARHNALTLPWGDSGERLLPTAAYETYTDAMREVRNTWDSAVADFIEAYPDLREQAKGRLNGLYREADYPTEDAVQAAFGMRVHFWPLPANGDFRLDLPAGQIGALEEQAETAMQDRLRGAVADCWARLSESLTRLRDGVAGERKGAQVAAIRDALVEQGRTMAAALAGLNVTNDPKLEELRRATAGLFASIDAAGLRKDASTRAETALKAQALLDQVSSYFGGAK